MRGSRRAEALAHGGRSDGETAARSLGSDQQSGSACVESTGEQRTYEADLKVTDDLSPDFEVDLELD